MLSILRQFQSERHSKGRHDLGWCIEIEITLREGKHHQIRRIVQRSNFTVVSLTRTRIAKVLDIDSVPEPGQCRWLLQDEVALIKEGLNIKDTISAIDENRSTKKPKLVTV